MYGVVLIGSGKESFPLFYNSFEILCCTKGCKKFGWLWDVSSECVLLCIWFSDHWQLGPGAIDGKGDIRLMAD